MRLRKPNDESPVIENPRFRKANVECRKPLRLGFDSAKTTDDNRNHWANADGCSADGMLTPEVRRILRNRCRYEVANNSYARGMVLTLAHDVVGTGPRLQLLTPDAKYNRRAELSFAAWSSGVNLAGKLRTLRMARAQDGEGFMAHVSVRVSQAVFPLEFNPYSIPRAADWIHEPDSFICSATPSSTTRRPSTSCWWRLIGYAIRRCP